MWNLLIQAPNEEFREVEFQPGVTSVGRSLFNTICIMDESATREHAKFTFDKENDLLFVIDLNSTNGTFVNGKMIKGSSRLEHEDIIRIGAHLLTVVKSDMQNKSQANDNWVQVKPVTRELMIESLDNYAVLLHEINERLNVFEDLKETLADVAELIRRLIGADNCQITTLEDLKTGVDSLPNTKIVIETIRENSAAISSFPLEDDAKNGNNETSSYGSVLSAPVTIDKEIVAVIYASRSTPGAKGFNHRDLSLIVGIISQVGLAIQRKQIEIELIYQASHDPVTGLPNRNMFMDHLRELIDISYGDSESQFSVIFIDIDNFKIINDSYGHLAGDELLRLISARCSKYISELSSETTTLEMARFGGDEFAILLSGEAGSQIASPIAEEILRLLDVPFEIAGQDVYATASIGITDSSMKYQQPEHVLRDADIAMYQAKESGKALYKVYDRAMHKKVLHKLRMSSGLRKAIDHEELVLYYQPIISVKHAVIVGFEALLRWNSPEMGLVYPEQIFNSSDSTSLLNSIDFWVLERACHQLADWHKSIPESNNLFMSVNLSTKQVRNPNLVDQVSHVLKSTNLNPKMLWLEITESNNIKDSKATLEMLTELRSQNVHLSLDDFGTGFSSLSYLPLLPIDSLKIDKSFIRRAGQSPDGDKIIKTIVTLSDNLNLLVVAEGVESLEQFNYVRKLNCDMAQGFYFSKPLIADDISTLLQTKPHWRPNPGKILQEREALPIDSRMY